MKLTERETEVLAELRANIEGCETIDASGSWMTVYLPNCKSSLEKGFNSILGSLKKKGLYVSQGDDCFGDVLVPESEHELDSAGPAA